RKLWIYYTTVAAAAGRLPATWWDGHITAQ
ncbi:MAG: hypothetical protein QOH87_4577, partial [Trebonia sp.]|nr:hypothetical protein [Trebonia sp.]